MTDEEWRRTDRFRDMIRALLERRPTRPRTVAQALQHRIGQYVRSRVGREPVAVPSRRKFQLLCAACCRHMWKYSPIAVPGLSFDDQVEAIELLADAAGRAPLSESALIDPSVPSEAIWELSRIGGLIGASGVVERLIPGESALGCGLVRDIFGESRTPPRIEPRWRTSDAVALARGIYEDRAFDRLPILADALMDAGCSDNSILNHCRTEGPHVRGCWVVDLILGKA
jgi:hypothetical protein